MRNQRGTVMGIAGLLLYIPVIISASMSEPPDELMAFAMGTLLVGMVMVMVAIFSQVRR